MGLHIKHMKSLGDFNDISQMNSHIPIITNNKLERQKREVWVLEMKETRKRLLVACTNLLCQFLGKSFCMAHCDKDSLLAQLNFANAFLTPRPKP
jgi:hypothetical protein